MAHITEIDLMYLLYVVFAAKGTIALLGCIVFDASQ